MAALRVLGLMLIVVALGLAAIISPPLSTLQILGLGFVGFVGIVLLAKGD